jgi:hypothetical protein
MNLRGETGVNSRHEPQERPELTIDMKLRGETRVNSRHEAERRDQS